MCTAAKLQLGISVDRILDNVCVEVAGTIEREHLMSRQDIHNIQYQLNLQSTCIEKHHNNHIAKCVSFAEMQDMAYNPVLFFKNQVESRVMIMTILEGMSTLFLICSLWFVASLSCINVVMSYPIMQYQASNNYI